MRNDNDRNPKDFYGKTEAELQEAETDQGHFPERSGTH